MLTPADCADRSTAAVELPDTGRDTPSQQTASRATRRTFAETVSGFGHDRLSSRPSYPRFREALADLIDETDAPLAMLLGDLRAAAISSPFGAPCPQCGTTAWPHRGRRKRNTFRGTYRCSACRHEFSAGHNITQVNWPN